MRWLPGVSIRKGVGSLGQHAEFVDRHPGVLGRGFVHPQQTAGARHGAPGIPIRLPGLAAFGSLLRFARASQPPGLALVCRFLPLPLADGGFLLVGGGEPPRRTHRPAITSTSVAWMPLKSGCLPFDTVGMNGAMTETATR